MAGFDESKWGVRAGGTIRSKLFLSIDDPGLYLLDLSVPLDELEMKRANLSTKNEYSKWTWTGQTHVIIDK